MNCFASVWYYNLCCVAGVAEGGILQRGACKACGKHPFIPEGGRAWHVSKAYILNGCSSGLTQLTLEVLTNLL